MVASTAFGKSVKKRLVDLEQTQGWLCGKVREKTGLYFDDSYLSKILTGKLTTPGMMNAIAEILDIPIMPDAETVNTDTVTAPRNSA